MPAPNLQREIQIKLQELLRLTNRVLPVKVGKVVVIDLDMHRVKNKCTQLAKYIHWKHADFKNGNIISCYVVKNDSAVLITAAEIEKGEEAIISELKKWIYSRNYRSNIDVRSLKLSRLLSTSIYFA